MPYFFQYPAIRSTLHSFGWIFLSYLLCVLAFILLRTIEYYFPGSTRHHIGVNIFSIFMGIVGVFSLIRYFIFILYDSLEFDERFFLRLVLFMFFIPLLYLSEYLLPFQGVERLARDSFSYTIWLSWFLLLSSLGILYYLVVSFLRKIIFTINKFLHSFKEHLKNKSGNVKIPPNQG